MRASPPQPSGGGNASPMQGVLGLHNTLRARHAAAPLSWDDSLASGAQEWADRCVFEHSGGGENLAENFPTPVDAVQASALRRGSRGLEGAGATAHARHACVLASCVRACLNSPPWLPHQAWYDEISMYDFSDGGYSPETGHATQLLWKASTTLGCGYAGDCKLLVCRYAPPGEACGGLSVPACAAVQATRACSTRAQPHDASAPPPLHRRPPGNVIGEFAENVAPPIGGA